MAEEVHQRRINMKLLIMASWQGQEPEEVDETDNLEDAKFMRREYQLAYGFDWNVFIKRLRRSCGGAVVCRKPHSCDCKERSW